MVVRQDTTKTKGKLNVEATDDGCLDVLEKCKCCSLSQNKGKQQQVHSTPYQSSKGLTLSIVEELGTCGCVLCLCVGVGMTVLETCHHGLQIWTNPLHNSVK